MLNTAYAMGSSCATSTTAQPPVLLQFLPLILLFVVFYFLLIRPQQKRQKEQMNMIAALGKGDEVITQGGIFGTIVSVEDKAVILKVDENTTVKILKTAVSVVVEKKS